MSVLRVYDPVECDERGVPLDWEHCRTCGGTGSTGSLHGIEGGRVVGCPGCEGHRSLRAAALAHCHEFPGGALDAPDPATRPVRCDGCGHPMSDGTWNDPVVAGLVGHVRTRMEGEMVVLRGGEPLATCHSTHYSPCDSQCHHGGPGRWWPLYSEGWLERPDESVPVCMVELAIKEATRVEASWRLVDVRCLGWPHDLRPDRLAVLCLRCWTDRRAGRVDDDG